MTGRKMALVIGPLGSVSNLDDDRAGDATWNGGCIHIRRRTRSVVVSVDFNRLTGPAVAAALYEIADMEPDRICFTTSENTTTELLIGFEPAFRRLREIFASVNLREESPDIPSVPGGITGHRHAEHRSGNGAYLHA